MMRLWERGTHPVHRVRVAKADVQLPGPRVDRQPFTLPGHGHPDGSGDLAGVAHHGESVRAEVRCAGVENDLTAHDLQTLPHARHPRGEAAVDPAVDPDEGDRERPTGGAGC